MFKFFGEKNKTSQSPPISNALSKALITKNTEANALDTNPTQDTTDYSIMYEKADAVYSCISFASDICSQLTFKVYEDKNGEKVEIKNDKLLQWFKQPNEFQSMSELLYLYMQSYFLNGNGYLSFEKAGGKFESWVLNPSKIKVVPDRKQFIKGYIFSDTISYKPNEIIHFKNASLGNLYYGLSYLSTLVDSLKIEGLVTEDLLNFYDNSLIAQGMFTSEYPLSQPQLDNLYEQFETLYGKGGKRRYGHLIVPNDLKYQSLKTNPKDSLLLESLEISTDKIFKVFRLSPALLGSSSQSDIGGSELKEYKKNYINSFIRPIINRLTKQLETFFRKSLKIDNLIIEADYTSIPEVNTALQEKIDSVKTAISLGLIHRNEGREVIGFAPIDGEYMNVLLAPSYLTGSNPFDLVSGEFLNLTGEETPTDDTKPVGSTDPEGGVADGI